MTLTDLSHVPGSAARTNGTAVADGDIAAAVPKVTQQKKAIPDGYVAAAAFEGVISYRKLDYWTRIGYLTAPQHVGSGYWRLWAETEVGVAAAISRLVAAGIDLDTAASIARDGVGTYPLRSDTVIVTTAELWATP